uniref:Uncharacterized protein n=1 Tax=Anguilla anguilla TaxID=7936 RepID=A0A0E9S6T0_ANGAN
MRSPPPRHVTLILPDVKIFFTPPPLSGK